MTNKELAASVELLKAEVASLKAKLEELTAPPKPKELSKAVLRLKEITEIPSEHWEDLMVERKKNCVELRLPRNRFGNGGRNFMDQIRTKLENRGHAASWGAGCLQVVLATPMPAMPTESTETETPSSSVI